MRLILILLPLLLAYEALALEYGQTNIRTLEGTGLYKNFRGQVISDDVRPYEPRFGLFSNVMQKRRFVFLPEGQPIVAMDLELWRYPNGTKIWKEFSVQLGADSIPIETRYMEKQDGAWRFGTYVWNAAGDNADLWNNESGSLPIDIDLPGMSGVSHAVPSYSQCVLCHDQESRSTSFKSGEPVLGFTSFQLPRAFIEGLYASQTLSGPTIPWQRHRTFAVDENERDVIGYLHANCGHCHNQRRTTMIPGAADDFLRLNYSLETHSNRNAMHVIQQIGRPVVNRNVGLPNVDASTRVIAPGDIDKSMIYLRMKRTQGVFKMPLLGINEADHDFIDGLFRRWVQRLTPRSSLKNKNPSQK
jgi:hypothetical protein